MRTHMQAPTHTNRHAHADIRPAWCPTVHAPHHSPLITYMELVCCLALRSRTQLTLDFVKLLRLALLLLFFLVFLIQLVLTLQGLKDRH